MAESRRGFVVRWLDGKRPVPPVGYKRALEEAQSRLLRRAKRFRLKRERDDFSWGPWLDLKETTKRLRNIAQDMPVGELVRVQCGGEKGRVLAVLAVLVVPPISLPSGSDRWHPQLQRLYQDVFGQTWRNGTPHFAGAENCRPNRRNPSEWSMHCYWPPVLAEDIGVDTLALGDEINAYIEREYPELITVWREPLHYSHIHAQVGHNRIGVPVCAQGA